MISSLQSFFLFYPTSLWSPVLLLALRPQGQLAPLKRWERLESGPEQPRPWRGWGRWDALQLELKTAHCFLRLAETEQN